MRYVASRGHCCYHHPDCRFVTGENNMRNVIRPENRLFFATEAEAKQPCSACPSGREPGECCVSKILDDRNRG